MSNKAITKIFISGEEHNIGLEDDQIKEQLNTRFVLKTEYNSNNTSISNNISELSNRIDNKLDITYKQEILNIVQPIGEIYVQFPGQYSPESLYNKEGIISSKWKIVKDYDGAFFRSEGKDANPFDNQTSCQNDVVGTHEHDADITIIPDDLHSHTVTTSFEYEQKAVKGGSNKVDTVNPYGGTGTVSLSSNSNGIHTHNVNAKKKKNNSDEDIENRPKNYTVRIWKRTE